jgi:hypothetical protein
MPSAISRILILLLVVHVLNLSIDAPDPLPDYIPEDMSVNDIETIAEYVLEKYLDIDNALPEHDEDDNAGDGKLKKVDFYCSLKCFLEILPYIDLTGSFRHPLHDIYTSLDKLSCLGPPPRTIVHAFC